MSTTKIQIEAGKRYVRRDGEISGVISPSGKLNYPWRCNRYLYVYDDSGRWLDEEDESDRDLIEEYVEPETVAPEEVEAEETTDSPTLQIEAGKRYVRRDGRITGVIESSIDPEFPWEDPENGRTYTDSGGWLNSVTDSKDLIEEYVEPADEPEPEAPADDTDEVGYRILEPDELVQEGDEVLSRDGWKYSWNAGKRQAADLKYRRPLKTDEAEELTAADVESDGWIEWSGGECPVNGGARVEILTKSGGSDTGTAICYLWQHYGNSEDIVAYREVPADQPAEPGYTLESEDMPEDVQREVSAILKTRVRPVSDGQPAEPEKQPQPGWVINQFNDIGWRTIGPDGKVVVLTEDMEAFGDFASDESEYSWEEVPDCTGFYWSPPPEATLEETRLRELDVSWEGNHYENTKWIGVSDPILTSADWVPEQLEAIAAHMRSVKGGAACQ